MAMTENGRCARCGGLISKDAVKCPDCGNHPAKTGKWAGTAMMAAGFLLSVTVVLAVVGIPLFVVGLAVNIGGRSLKPIDHDFGGGD